MTPPKRPPTHRERNTPAKGSMFVKEEPTPPPQELPRLEDLELATRLRVQEAQLRDLTDRAQVAHEARHDHDEVIRLGGKIESYTQGMENNEAMVADTRAWLGQLAPKVEQCLATAAHTAEGVERLHDKLDAFADRFGAIEKEQARAAVRFEEHDKRDAEIEKLARDTQGRVVALEQFNEIEDATARVRRQHVVRAGKWRSRLFKALAGLAIAGAGWLTHYIAGG